MKAKIDLQTQHAEVEAQLKEVGDFVGQITPTSIKETGGIIHDQVRFWRWKNQVRILKKAKVFIGNDLDLHEVGIKVLVPLLENASLEDEDSLQNKWAAMLANAATQQQSVLPLFPELLKELSSTEVLILDELYKTYHQSSTQPIQFSKVKVREVFNLNKNNTDVIIENLFRLNICTSPGSVGAMIGEYPFSIHTNEIFELTALGIAFISACKFEVEHKKS